MDSGKEQVTSLQYTLQWGGGGGCIMLRLYQIRSLDKPSFTTSIVRVLFHALFHVHNMFRP
jgi:hypothetical protein